MVLIDSLDTQTFICKKKKNTVSVKHSKAKCNKTGTVVEILSWCTLLKGSWSIRERNACTLIMFVTWLDFLKHMSPGCVPICPLQNKS